jgi:hypothetical protein
MQRDEDFWDSDVGLFRAEGWKTRVFGRSGDIYDLAVGLVLVMECISFILRMRLLL